MHQRETAQASRDKELHFEKQAVSIIDSKQHKMKI